MSPSDHDVNIIQASGTLSCEIQASMQKFRTAVSTNISQTNKQKDNSNLYKVSKEGPEKMFIFRESLITIMFQIQDFKTIYNMVAASFVILTFNLFYDNYTRYGQIADFRAFSKIFSCPQRVLMSWVFLVMIHFTIIPIMKLALYSKIYFWLPIYFLHIFSLFYLAIMISSSEDLGFGSVFIIMSEATRMFMKSHSYLRTKLLYLTENRYKQFQINDISVKTCTNKEQNFSQSSSKKYIIMKINNGDYFHQIHNLVYFFFVPTLMYRDQYTLTPVRNINAVIINIINFFSCVYYAFILYIYCVKDVIQETQKNLSFSTLLLSLIKLMLPSVFFLLLGFFGFLHSWLNIWAEITRFPDRAFYSDWWNSIQFGSYYRKWNINVHDWLYYYIYLDLRRFFSLCNRSTVIPKFLTFLFSAVIHQLIISLSLGFFYPILFGLFTGPGILLIQNQNRLKVISINFLFWLEMYIGTSMIFTFYLVEYSARNTPNVEIYVTQKWGAFAIFIPRTMYLGQ